MKEPVPGAEGELRFVRDQTGRPLRASYRIERVGESLTIVFESRGGTRGSEAERNPDYADGLLALLTRLGAAGISLADVVVESRDTASLPREERSLGGASYPVTIDDPDVVRRWISSAQAGVGRAPGAKGSGNRTRRLRLFLDGDPARLDEPALVRGLGEGQDASERSKQ